MFRDLASFWHELGGNALRVLAFQEAASQRTRIAVCHTTVPILVHF